MNRMRTVVLAALLGAPAAAAGCGPAVRPEPDEPNAPASARFAAHEGRYAMLSTLTGTDGRTEQETGIADLWVESDGAMRMTIALGDDAEPEGWAELREDPATGLVRWVTVTGHFEPSITVWDGRKRPDGTIALDRVPADDCASGEAVEAVFSFPDADTVRIVLTSRAADGSTGSTEDDVYTRTGSTERRWAPAAPPTAPPDRTDVTDCGTEP
jgi:hypothetical protein